jgi:predicted esterase
MIQENHLTVTKTARYFTLGNLTENTRQVWIVIHGFRQSAKSFLKEFEPLLNDKNFFIAPEALNRFYLTRQGKEVGASWMTREDRLNEIKDYINYLEQLYTSLQLDKYNTQIIALGFSQGASTVTRWIDASQNKIDLAIVYAGEVAPELLPLKENSGLKKTRNYYVCGTKDEFFTPAALSIVKNVYSELNFTEIFFEGTHEINVEALRRVDSEAL